MMSMRQLDRDGRRLTRLVERSEEERESSGSLGGGRVREGQADSSIREEEIEEGQMGSEPMFSAGGLEPRVAQLRFEAQDRQKEGGRDLEMKRMVESVRDQEKKIRYRSLPLASVKIQRDLKG